MVVDVMIGWKGELIYLNCGWSAEYGHRVTFRITEHGPQNPFAETFRSGPRRLRVLLNEYGDSPGPFDFEALLDSVGNNPNFQTIDLRLDHTDDSPNPFRKYERETPFGAVVQQINDDETVLTKPKLTPHRSRLSQYSATLCRTERFQRYVSWRTGTPAGEIECADWVRAQCCVSSRARLDHDPDAEHAFHELVRKPYQKWDHL